MVSKEFLENIDLEEGKILIDGKWLTEDEIRYAIKMKVESDDYNIAELAMALQTLINEMNKSTILKVRVPREMAEEYGKLGVERGESVESLLKSILIEYLNKESTSLEEPKEEETETYEDLDISSSIEEPEDNILEIEEENDVDIGLLSEEDEDIDISIDDDDIYEDDILEEESAKEDEDIEEIVDVQKESAKEAEDIEEIVDVEKESAKEDEDIEEIVDVQKESAKEDKDIEEIVDAEKESGEEDKDIEEIVDAEKERGEEDKDIEEIVDAEKDQLEDKLLDLDANVTESVPEDVEVGEDLDDKDIIDSEVVDEKAGILEDEKDEKEPAKNKKSARKKLIFGRRKLKRKSL